MPSLWYPGPMSGFYGKGIPLNECNAFEVGADRLCGCQTTHARTQDDGVSPDSLLHVRVLGRLMDSAFFLAISHYTRFSGRTKTQW
jgi:hypothetical protein